MRLLRVLVDKALDGVKILRPLALDHVTHQRPRSSRETDQWHAIIEALLRELDRVKDILQPPEKIGREFVDIRTRAYRIGKHGASRFDQLKVHSHRLRNDQNVREKYRRVDADDVDGLYRDLSGKFRRFAESEEVRLTTDRAVLGQIPSRLTHDPNRRSLDMLTA